MKRLNTNSLRSLFFSLFPLVLSVGAGAQDFTGYNWYFGNSPNGVRFSRSDKSVSLGNNQTALGTGGSAVANSAVNGDVLFYSDGETIYDVSGQPMPNGTGLGGNPAGNQGVAVAKVPGQDNQYYVFVNSADGATGGTVSYRIVDMSLQGNSDASNPTPFGEATSATNTTLAGLTNTSESMIVVQQQGSENFWLITHDNGTNTYTVTLVTSAGPQPPTTYNVGVITQPGNLAFHAGSNKIAVSPQEANRNVEIVNFNPTNGQITLDQEVPNSAVASTSGVAIYDTEWSFSGQYLYISRRGEAGVPGNVMQFDTANPTVTMASILPQPNTIHQSFGLQMGPDSTIYHLYQATPGGPFLMGSISDTDSVAADVVYTPQVFPGVNFGGMQFPSFSPPDTTNLTVTFPPVTACANTAVGFFPTVVPGADSLSWDFGDGSGSSDWSPVYTYETAGSYNVTVTAYLNGQTATSTEIATITDFDTQINLVQDTTACSCELPFPRATNPPPQCGQFSVTAQVQGNGTPQLQWYGPGGLIPGATSETLQPDSAGYYYLVATVGNCATYAGVNIKEYDVEDQRANVWYFGNQAGIDFNPNIPNAPVPITNPVMNAPEGTSTISDRNGQVVLFTDGVSVWDRNFNLVSSPPPPGIGGSAQSAQAALIVPVPGDETLYYIFTTKDVYGDGTFELRYSLFDLKLNGGTGGMLEENQLLFARSTERITGSEGWLIAHEYGNNSFRAYPISNLGIGNPVISAVGSDHSVTTASTGQGYMKLGPQNRLAVALSTEGSSNVVELFDFNATTGVISNFRSADLNSPAGNVYGIEFSPGGNKVYATLRNGGASQLMEIAIDTLSGEPILMTPPLATGSDMGAIQIGPTGQIYVAVNGQSALGTIQPSELQNIPSVYNATGFALLPGTTSTLGLPNFIQNLADPIQGPFMTIAGQCVQDSVTFSATPTDPIDRFFWQVRFGGSVVTTSTAQEFDYLFTTPGLYDVSLRLTNRCGLDTTLVQQLRINDLPPDPTSSAVLCTGSVVLDANPANLPGFRYVWSTGDTTKTITVNQRGYYDVRVTNAAGCSVDGRILAADNRPVVNLGDNETLCQNTPVAALDALNPGANYAWTLTLNGGAPTVLGTRRTQAVTTNYSATTTAEYEVTVTDPVTSCFIRDSVIYTINPLPVITTPVANSIACGATTGTIDFDITAPASALFTYSITGPSTLISDTDVTVGPVPQATGLAAGTYSITVADQVTTCAVTTAATINNNNFTVTGLQDVNCDPINIDVTIAPTGPPSATYTWRVLDTSLPLPPTGQGVQRGTTPVVTFNTSSATVGPIGLPSNNEQYIVEVTDAGGCIASSTPITINHDPKVPAFFDINCDPVAPVSITASQGDTFAWTGPDIIGGTANAQTVRANPPSGTRQYQVLITQAGFCDLDTTLSVVMQPPILAAIDQSSACSDLVTVSATPNGNFLYRWFINNVFQPSLGGPEVFANLSNDGQQYSVSIVSPLTGCESTSNALIVQVDNELTVDLETTTPCEGSPFTITATPSRTSTFVWALDGNTIAGQTASTLQEQRAGVYRVTASAAACTATDEINISLAPITPGLLNDEAFICPDPANPDPNTRSVELRPGQFTSYDWLKDGVSLGINTPTLVADEPGLYSVVLENSFGCPSTDRTEVLLMCDPVIVGPNAFRPTSAVVGLGGDMVNQTFHLYTFFIDDEDFEVFIFNRWGEMIFQSSDRDFRWNGGYKNNIAQLSPAGTYSYLVRYKSSYRPGTGIMEKRGGVVLMR